MENTKKNNNNKPNENKRNLVIGACSLIAVVVLVAVIILVNNNKKVEDVKKDKPDEEEKVKIKTYTEQELIDAYGMSIKDAEELVMEYYHSDNFECSTEIVEAHYKVTVTETLSGDKYVYDVNPATHEYIRDK